MSESTTRKIAKNSLSGSFAPSVNFSKEIKYHAIEIVRKLEALLSDPSLTDPETRKKYETLLIIQKAIISESFQHDLFVKNISKRFKTLTISTDRVDFIAEWFQQIWKIDQKAKSEKLKNKKRRQDDISKNFFYGKRKKDIKASKLIIELVGKSK